MKSLKDYILEAHDMLGHEIKVGVMKLKWVTGFNSNQGDTVVG